jgi:hypothetical protein
MRIARSTGAVSGLLIALLGIWGALIPFVGPYFDYSFGTNSTWHYTADRLWLNILPGALALLAGLLLMTASRRPSGTFGGWLAVIAGTWFVIGPAVSLTWESGGPGAGPIGRPLFGSTRQMFELVGYFYGLGALIIALGAFAAGRFVSRPLLRAGPAMVAAPAGPAAARSQTAPAAAGAGPAPARAHEAERTRPRRFGLGRLREKRAQGAGRPAENGREAAESDREPVESSRER